VQGLPEVELGGFEPPTSWVRYREREVVRTRSFAAFSENLRKAAGVKYAGIRTDMRGARHYWRKVPETRLRRLENVLSHPMKALGAPKLIQGTPNERGSCGEMAIRSSGEGASSSAFFSLQKGFQYGWQPFE
jgi:hypothetical protein